METAFVSCVGCGARLKVPATISAGTRIKCSKCGHVAAAEVSPKAIALAPEIPKTESAPQVAERRYLPQVGVLAAFLVVGMLGGAIDGLRIGPPVKTKTEARLDKLERQRELERRRFARPGDYQDTSGLEMRIRLSWFASWTVAAVVAGACAALLRGPGCVVAGAICGGLATVAIGRSLTTEIFVGNALLYYGWLFGPALLGCAVGAVIGAWCYPRAAARQQPKEPG
jgi:hypothetical protein